MSDIDLEKINQLIAAYKVCTDEKKKRVLYLNIFEQSIDIVKRIANKIAPYVDVSFDDLTQVGSVGLMKAIDSFKVEHNAKFNTYATYFIKGEIRHYLRDKSHIIKIPREKQELFSKISNLTRSLIKDGEKEPSVEEIADILAIPAAKVEEILNIDNYKDAISLDQYLNNEYEDLSVLDTIPAENYQELISKYENKILLTEVINKLPDELREIIQMNYFEDMSQREIAQKINSTQMQVSRKLKKALNKMYEYIMNKE